MARNLTDTAAFPMRYGFGIRVYRGPETRITLRSIRATTAYNPDGTALRRNPGLTWHGTQPIPPCCPWGMFWVSGYVVTRNPGLRFAPSGLQRCITLMEPLCGAIRDGHGTEPNEYRRVARGVWFRVSGFIGARKPGFHFVPSGLRQQVII